MTNTNIKTGWKVVCRRSSDNANGSVLESACAPSQAAREYRMGEWTEPGLWAGPLFVFAQRDDASDFAAAITADDRGTYEVYPCEWEPWCYRLARPWGVPLAGWGPDLRTRLCPDRLVATDMPWGTRLARRVRLLERAPAA